MKFDSGLHNNQIKMGCQCDKEQSVTQDQFIPQNHFSKKTVSMNQKNSSKEGSNSIYIVPPSLTINSNQVRNIRACPENLFVDIDVSDMFKQNINSKSFKSYSQVAGLSRNQNLGTPVNKKLPYKSIIQQN